MKTQGLLHRLKAAFFRPFEIVPKVELKIGYADDVETTVQLNRGLAQPAYGYAEIRKALPGKAWRSHGRSLVEVTWQAELVGRYGATGYGAYRINGTVRLTDLASGRTRVRTFAGGDPPAQIPFTATDRSRQPLTGSYPVDPICRYIAKHYHPGRTE